MARHGRPGQRHPLPPRPQGTGGGGVRTAVPYQQPPSADYSSDPILQQIRALAAQNNAAAEASAHAAGTQALIRFGYDPSMAGLYGDANTQAAAQGNPFSVLANLARTHQQRQTTLNQNLNKANLFYSSYRGQQLQNEGTQYLGEQTNAQQSLRDALGGISNSLLGAESGNQQRVQQGEQDAYQRQLAFSLAHGGLRPRTQTPLQRLRTQLRGHGRHI